MKDPKAFWNINDLISKSTVPGTDISKERDLSNDTQIMPSCISSYVSVWMMAPFCMYMTFIFLP